MGSISIRPCSGATHFGAPTAVCLLCFLPYSPVPSAVHYIPLAAPSAVRPVLETLCFLSCSGVPSAFCSGVPAAAHPVRGSLRCLPPFWCFLCCPPCFGISSAVRPVLGSSLLSTLFWGSFCFPPCSALPLYSPPCSGVPTTCFGVSFGCNPLFCPPSVVRPVLESPLLFALFLSPLCCLPYS